MGNREDKYVVTVVVSRGNESRNLGVWDTFDGGETESEDTKYRRGGLSRQESLGGSKSVTNITSAHLYDDFMQANEPWCEAGVGNADVTMTKQPLDENGSAFGQPRVYTGKLIAWRPPSHDSQSSDPARLEIEVAPNGDIG